MHCKEGTSFIKSIEDSDQPHTGSYIFKWIENCINKVDEKNVIQVVTDNHSSNMMAKNMLATTRLRIFWSSCVTHIIDLMLEDIGNLPKYKTVIENARCISVFLYSHIGTIALMGSTQIGQSWFVQE